MNELEEWLNKIANKIKQSYKNTEEDYIELVIRHNAQPLKKYRLNFRAWPLNGLMNCEQISADTFEELKEKANKLILNDWEKQWKQVEKD